MLWINQVSRETKEHLIAVAVIFIITVIFFWPLLRGRTFSMVGAHMFAQHPWGSVISGDPREVYGRGFTQVDQPDGLYPVSVFATNAVRSGQLPMWLPYSFSGVPIMETGSVGNGLVYPPQVLGMTVFSPIRQHDFLLFTHLLLAGLGMYALLRCWGANVLGGLFGAVVWQLNGHSAFFLEFQFVTIAAAWFPLMMLGATLAIRKQSWYWALATGVALGMSVLHGVQHWEYLGTLVLVCWYVPLTMLAARRLFLKGARQSALLCLSLPIISGITAAALSAASWLSLLGLLSHVHRQPLPLEAQASMVLPLKSFVRGLIFPLSSVTPQYGPDWPSLGLVGVPALILVFAAFFRRSGPVIFATIMGLGSLGMIFGLRPLFILLRLVFPYFGAMRPLDAYYVFCFAIAVLAALGLSEISQRFDQPGMRKRLLLGLACPLIAVECAQLILFAWITNPTHPVKPEWLFPETPMITNLKAAQGEFHVLPVSYRDPAGGWTPAVLSGKVAIDFNLRSSSGYESLLPQWTANLWRTVEKGGVVSDDLPPSYRPYFYHDRLPIHLLENLSVGFLATAPNAEPIDVNGSKSVADGSLQLVYQGPDGRIYKLKNALPRAFLVPSVIVAPDQQTSLRMLVDPKFNAREAAIVIGEDAAAKTGLPLDSSAAETGARAGIVRDRLNDVEVGIETPRAAMLVLNDSWDSGWKAEVDGVPQPVLRVNYAFRGIVVPAGNHNVKFLYRPPLVLIGLVISGVTIILLTLAFSLIGVASLRRFYRTRSRSNHA